MFGTRYIFQVSIAILRLIEYDLLRLDLQGINDYFKSFKDEEKSSFQGGSSGGGDSGNKSLLPPIETIISESLTVVLNEQSLDELKQKFKELHAPMKKEKKKNKIKKLASLKKNAIEEKRNLQQLQLIQEEEKIMMEDYNNEEDNIDR